LAAEGEDSQEIDCEECIVISKAEETGAAAFEEGEVRAELGSGRVALFIVSAKTFMQILGALEMRDLRCLAIVTFNTRQ
jgi:hypothetical protein